MYYLGLPNHVIQYGDIHREDKYLIRNSSYLKQGRYILNTVGGGTHRLQEYWSCFIE